MAKDREAAANEPSDYWNATRRPISCLVFLAPLLAAYEAGVYLVGGSDADAVRNGADAWMRGGLEYLGLNRPWLLPAMIVAGLLIWQIARSEPWRLSWTTLGGMLAESLLFALALVVIGTVESQLFRQAAAGAGRAAAAVPTARVAGLAVVFVGAGIYEEVLFRLFLLPASAALFRGGGLGSGSAAGLAILATSLAFSIAHYVGPAGEAFHLFTFVFRTVAGLFFAALFVLRGFGIAVGAHAAYDIVVGLVLSQAL